MFYCKLNLINKSIHKKQSLMKTFDDFIESMINNLNKVKDYFMRLNLGECELKIKDEL